MIATGSAPYVNGWGKLQVKLALEIFFAPLPFTGFAPLVPVLRRSPDVGGRDTTTGPAATGPLASATSAANGEPLRSMSATAGQLRSRGLCLVFSDYIFYAASS